MHEPLGVSSTIIHDMEKERITRNSFSSFF
jgi:hypothetical protein